MEYVLLITILMRPSRASMPWLMLSWGTLLLMAATIWIDIEFWERIAALVTFAARLQLAMASPGAVQNLRNLQVLGIVFGVAMLVLVSVLAMSILIPSDLAMDGVYSVLIAGVIVHDYLHWVRPQLAKQADAA
jgi:hypothetical protein